MKNKLLADQPKNAQKRTSTLRDERMSQLLESCQEEVLRQIVGPFGLSAAMFTDKDGGSVTTQHNAEKGIFAKESEELNRENDYNYTAAKGEKMRQGVQDGTMNSQEFVDSYTGKIEPTKRTREKDGKLVMNAELDHTVPIKEIHGAGGWMKDSDGRNKLSSIDVNLNYTTFKTNRSKGGSSPEESLSEENGFDSSRIEPIVKNAREAIKKDLPSTSERVMYHGKELVKEGGKDAIKNALRQALGVLLHEFVSGSFIELKSLLKDRDTTESLVDRLINSLKRIMNRVIEKGKHALDAALQGGIQGIVSNLLTFMINTLVTTSKKIVTIIRESMQSLWTAIKLMANPPEGMSTSEITRQVTKIIAAVVTTGIGMLMEESVKGFIASISVLLPIADALAAGLTAIMTGIAGALIVYGIDRLFDWLNSTGTELLAAQESNVEAQALVVGSLQNWLGLQYANSRMYEVCVSDYQQMQKTYSGISVKMKIATTEAATSINSRDSMIETVLLQIERKKRLEDALKLI